MSAQSDLRYHNRSKYSAAPKAKKNTLLEGRKIYSQMFQFFRCEIYYFSQVDLITHSHRFSSYFAQSMRG